MKVTVYYFAAFAGISGQLRESIARFVKTRITVAYIIISVKKKKTIESMFVTAAKHI
jgi:hypothetical protein